MKTRLGLQAVLLCGAFNLIQGSTTSTGHVVAPTAVKGSCTTKINGAKLEGTAISNGLRSNVEVDACIELCDAETDCHFWSWQGAGANTVCRLFSDRTSQKRVEGAMSGECSLPVDPNAGKCLPAASGEPPVPRFMLIGETGVGKSTLGKRLMGNSCGDYASANFEEDESLGCPIQKVGDSFSSMTNDTTWIAGRWLGGNATDTPCFAVVDTPGIGDTSGPGKDCKNFQEVAMMAREISPIDAFVLVIRGDMTRVQPELVKQLQFFQELFGDKFWDHTIIAVSFWGHTRIEAYLRKKNSGGLDEQMFERKLRLKLMEHFDDLPPIPTVFIDPVYDEFDEFADERGKKWFAQETKKLWKLITNGEKYECGDSCTSSTFFQGKPRLEGKGVVAQRINGTVSVRWSIWFGDCDDNGVRSFMILKDNKIIYEMVEEPYITGEDWEAGRSTATAEKPPSLDIVDTCSNLKPNTLECDNNKAKYKTITLTFGPLIETALGKYKIKNIKGESEEMELVAIVDGIAGEWGEWGACSKSCIGKDMTLGSKQRRRTASEPVNGGKPFSGLLIDSMNCGNSFCKSKPGDWTPWGACSKSCGEGGIRERSRTCVGYSCPETRQRKDCSADDDRNDWIEKCPAVSKYTSWSRWSCNTNCFNPNKRSGTSMTRRRTCIDDKPVPHRDYNCDQMNILEETAMPCNSEPEGYMTRYGVQCLPGSTCGNDYYTNTQSGKNTNYYWCRTGSASDAWDKCSTDRRHTVYGKKCNGPCEKNGGTEEEEEEYYWCWTEPATSSWHYCTPGKDVEKCDGVCATKGESYYWCYTKNWDYCSPRC